MGAVTKTYQTEEEFGALIIISDFRLSFAANTKELAGGASLIALKNQWVRDVMEANPNIFEKRALNDVGKEAVVLLRDLVENYFMEKTK